MTLTQQIITIAIAALVTAATRFLPFAIFRSDRKTPGFLAYLGRALPPAVFGMLVVYCLKGVSLTVAPYGLAELIGVATVVIIHLAFRKMPLSIVGGTAVYILLVNLVFV